MLCLVVAGIVIAVAAGGSTAQVRRRGPAGQRRPARPRARGRHRRDRPAFARLGDRNLLLPVAAGDATIIAYQPVSDERAVALTPIGDQANTNALVSFFRGIFSGGAVGALLPARRRRPERPPVRSWWAPRPALPSPRPSPGSVTAVKEYKLYGKYDDVQIDIRPEEMSGITVSLLFIDDPAVSIGEVVTAGKTQLGKVRECPEELGKQLWPTTPMTPVHTCIMQVTEEPIS